MSEYAAAVGLVQLQRWPLLLQRRREVHEQYRRRLAALPQVSLQDLDTPPATFCVRLPADAAAAAARLAQAGIETRRWYLPPLNRHPAFAGARCLGPGGSDRLPVTEDLASSLIGLPFHSRLSAEDVVTVVDALVAALPAAASA
jgi:dTDP-4-amino-4,6-dideoxygalactose transaminase